MTTQYTASLVEMAKEAMRQKVREKTKELLNRAPVYPENLGEGRLGGTKDSHVYYYLGYVAEASGGDNEATLCSKRITTGTDEPAGMMYYSGQPTDMTLYQGSAKSRLNWTAEAKARFYRLTDYGGQYVDGEAKVEYFAVSLLDFLIFEDDLNVRNKARCYYLMGPGKLGLESKEKTTACFDKTLNYDPNHQNALQYRAKTV